MRPCLPHQKKQDYMQGSEVWRVFVSLALRRHRPLRDEDTGRSTHPQQWKRPHSLVMHTLLAPTSRASVQVTKLYHSGVRGIYCNPKRHMLLQV